MTGVICYAFNTARGCNAPAGSHTSAAHAGASTGLCSAAPGPPGWHRASSLLAPSMSYHAHPAPDMYSLLQKYRKWLLGAWPAGPYSLRDTGPETQLRVRGKGPRRPPLLPWTAPPLYPSQGLSNSQPRWICDTFVTEFVRFFSYSSKREHSAQSLAYNLKTVTSS